MQEDKQLGNLLQQFALEETSVDFTQHIMQRIEAQKAAKHTAGRLINPKLLRLFAGGFAMVVAALLIVCISHPTIVFPFHFITPLPANYISQITSFLIVFWVVMFMNLFYQKKNKFAL